MTSFYYYDQNPSGFFAFLCKLGLLLTSLEFSIIKWQHRAKANNWDIEGLYYFNKISSISTSTLFIKNGITIDWPTK